MKLNRLLERAARARADAEALRNEFAALRELRALERDLRAVTQRLFRALRGDAAAGDEPR